MSVSAPSGPSEMSGVRCSPGMTSAGFSFFAPRSDALSRGRGSSWAASATSACGSSAWGSSACGLLGLGLLGLRLLLGRVWLLLFGSVRLLGFLDQLCTSSGSGFWAVCG